jgi:hypothetical protein
MIFSPFFSFSYNQYLNAFQNPDIMTYHFAQHKSPPVSGALCLSLYK